MATRDYSSNRNKVVQALANKLKLIDGTGEWLTNVNGKVFPRLRFWDEIEETPEINLSAGNETREYNGGGLRWRDLQVTIRVYVEHEEDPQNVLGLVLQDVETSMEDPTPIKYYDTRNVEHQIVQVTIVSISTDEGALAPVGVGEMVILVRY